MARRLGVNSMAGWTTYVATALLFPASVTSFYYARTPHVAPAIVVAAPETIEISRISAYDEIIQRLARSRSLDWRLVASIIHVESSFRRDVTSSAGAKGLMQVMPVVAREQRTRLSTHPEDNIALGVAHFMKKMQRIKGRTSADTLMLSLAAYNAGLGHVRDAQNLAIKHGKSPRRWKEVSKTLLLLEDPAHYKTSKYGYCQGANVIQYVNRVLRQYRRYQKIYSETPTPIVAQEKTHAAHLPST